MDEFDFPEALSYRRYLSWIEHASVGGVGARDRILHPLVGAHLGYFLTAVLVSIWPSPGQVPLNLGIGVEFVDFGRQLLSIWVAGKLLLPDWNVDYKHCRK